MNVSIPNVLKKNYKIVLAVVLVLAIALFFGARHFNSIKCKLQSK